MTFSWQCDLKGLFTLSILVSTSVIMEMIRTHPYSQEKHEQMQHKYNELLIFHKDYLCTLPHDSPKFSWGLPTLLRLGFLLVVNSVGCLSGTRYKAFCVKRSSHP